MVPSMSHYIQDRQRVDILNASVDVFLVLNKIIGLVWIPYFLLKQTR